MGKDVIVACDFASKDALITFLDKFSGRKPFVKIGMELFYAEGPQIVKEIRNDTGVIKSYQTQVVNKVISEDTSSKMREVLEQVVSAPDGTGKNAYVAGYRVGGKTGTSQKGDRSGTKRIASFVGFAPADDPQIVCLIMLDEPQVANKFGGSIAAPVAGAVIEDTLEYLGVERQTEESSSQDKTPFLQVYLLYSVGSSFSPITILSGKSFTGSPL